ncbi:MAG TPA: UDP-N-acetylmuramoyl-L-alanyl-D-glutamate--2,6-diaminopimelate ligase [Candidatus Atribacteria bacterium]|nr:UDP-N-acetylmuramoyl-L-alanyl-D-glutamate--2,6-diaminopimelate ligase [Candidatus Atribacteria bacterium]
MILKDIVKDLEILRIEGSPDKDIDALHYDSRQVTPGSLFFCIKGLTSDGHDFARMAVDKGAVAVVAEKDIPLPDHVTKIFVPNTRIAMSYAACNFYNRPSETLLLIGVTGTNGKTTTTYLTRSILEQAGIRTGLIGTIANIVGDQTIPAVRTTPEAPELQGMFRAMLDEGIRAAVMEVSSHSLELYKVDGSKFDVGVFTNLTRDHLDFHGTFDNYRRAKARLFGLSRAAAINTDDESGMAIIRECKDKAYSYGIRKSALIYADELDLSSEGTEFRLCLPGSSFKVRLGLTGMFNVYNALAAASACFAANIAPECIKSGLEAVRRIPGRLERLDTGTDFTVLIDYAHTPDGLENVLRTARGLSRGRLITLFGCGGDRDKSKREVMGEIAGRYSDLCIVTSDNPRSEEPMEIIRQILPGVVRTGCAYEVIENRRDAIEFAIKNGRKDDLIIIAGKGHETYQILKDKIISFDEKEIIASLLGREKV